MDNINRNITTEEREQLNTLLARDMVCISQEEINEIMSRLDVNFQQKYEQALAVANKELRSLRLDDDIFQRMFAN